MHLVRANRCSLPPGSQSRQDSDAGGGDACSMVDRDMSQVTLKG